MLTKTVGADTAKHYHSLTGAIVDTLKNDDAESGDEEDEDLIARKESKAVSEKRDSEKQPTGKVVGVIKRLWRPCVSFLPSLM